MLHSLGSWLSIPTLFVALQYITFFGGAAVGGVGQVLWGRLTEAVPRPLVGASGGVLAVLAMTAMVPWLPAWWKCLGTLENTYYVPGQLVSLTLVCLCNQAWDNTAALPFRTTHRRALASCFCQLHGTFQFDPFPLYCLPPASRHGQFCLAWLPKACLGLVYAQRDTLALNVPDLAILQAEQGLKGVALFDFCGMVLPVLPGNNFLGLVVPF